MTAMGGLAAEVATIEEERDTFLEALTDLVAAVRKEDHRSPCWSEQDGKRECLRCRADRLAEEHNL